MPATTLGKRRSAAAPRLPASTAPQQEAARYRQQGAQNEADRSPDEEALPVLITHAGSLNQDHGSVEEQPGTDDEDCEQAAAAGHVVGSEARPDPDAKDARVAAKQGAAAVGCDHGPEPA